MGRCQRGLLRSQLGRGCLLPARIYIPACDASAPICVIFGSTFSPLVHRSRMISTAQFDIKFHFLLISKSTTLSNPPAPPLPPPLVAFCHGYFTLARLYVETKRHTRTLISCGAQIKLPFFAKTGHMCDTTALPNSLHLSSLAPGIRRWKS